MEEEAKLKLIQMQSLHGQTESKLSVVEAENSSLKSENRKLVSHLSTMKEQERPKVFQNLIGVIYPCISQELELQKAKETIEILSKEFTSVKEEKVHKCYRVNSTIPQAFLILTNSKFSNIESFSISSFSCTTNELSLTIFLHHFIYKIAIQILV